MDYMGFHDLFDHLLEKNNGRNKQAAVSKVSSTFNPRPFKDSRRAKTNRKFTPQNIDMGTEVG